MSYQRCCVRTCKNNQKNQVLHRFPNPAKELERFRNWVIAVENEIVGLTNEYIYKNRRICSIHFEKKYAWGNNRLGLTAVPTLYMPGCRAHSTLANSCQRQPSSVNENMAPVESAVSEYSTLSPLKTPILNEDISGNLFLKSQIDEKEKGILPIEATETADIFLFFNNLFDILHSSFRKHSVLLNRFWL